MRFMPYNLDLTSGGIIYENEYCGNANPVFTFNFKKAFDKYKCVC